MRVVVAADEARPVVDHVARHLGERGHEARVLPVQPWGKAALAVARAVARGEADFGVVCCWTGTGVSIAANKVPGVRAALCTDAETARGARRWNDANVLALGLRLTSEALAGEILEAFLTTGVDADEVETVARLAEGV